ncbi:MAG TPA: NAD-dependent epimerase/dehydratase family protein [Longimicrobiales bacterium]|nr:NAD-dependent epimerase/dehydratase family protein [Longimicrobiales bacterium]
MSVALVTGSSGFIGTHARRRLSREGWTVRTFDREHPTDRLDGLVDGVDAILHLAGVNRPDDERAFDEVNRGLTADLVDSVIRSGGAPTVVFSSSIHVEGDSAYGRSKLAAERELQRLADDSSCAVLVDRLPGVFGPGARPGYNSVVATFCHRIARDEPVEVHDAGAEIRIVEVGTVVDRWTSLLADHRQPGYTLLPVIDAHLVTVGDLAQHLTTFARLYRDGLVPNTSDPLRAELFSTFVSHFDPDSLSAELTLHADDRGWLAELIKSTAMGQIFVSATRPGVTRGNHYHDRKVEKFFVVRGSAVVRLRAVEGTQVREYQVSGDRPSVIDIPPGYVHNIENVGDTELIVLFWANEVFDPGLPDTIAEEV